MRRTVFASALGLSLVGASPAAAQVIPAQVITQEPALPAARLPAPGLVPRHEVLTIVRSVGYNPLERPTRRGVTYTLRAVDSVGWLVRLVVDAQTGEIHSATQLGRQMERSADPSLGPRAVTSPSPGYIGPDRQGSRPGSSPQNPIYEDDRPGTFVPRPPASVPSAPVAGVPQREPVLPNPQIIAPEPGGGPLPPPPERFPNRAQPGPEPKLAPPKRAVSAALPKVPPLPRPRPGAIPVSAPAAPVAVVPEPAGEPKIPAPETKSSPAKSPADPLPH